MFIQFFQKYLEELWIQNQMYIGAFVFRNLKKKNGYWHRSFFLRRLKKKMVIVDTLLSRSFMNGRYTQLRKRKRLKQNMKRTFLPSKVTMKK